MTSDIFYKRCALLNAECSGVVQFHHVWIYAGRQINEKWAIVPACEHHHELVKKDRRIKEAFEFISLCRTKPGELKKYPKKDWQRIYDYLLQLPC